MKPLLLALAVFTTALVSAQGKPLTAKQVYQLSRGSIVGIRTAFHTEGKSMVGSGTGFFLGTDDVVATAYHVVKGAESIEVIDVAGKKFSARSIATDPASDTALLYLLQHSKRRPLSHKVFAKVDVGDPVFVIGDSLGLLPNSLSQGIVSGKRKMAGVPYVQTTAPISQGNSGGPLLDDQGNVVGIVSFYLRNAQNLNMAVAMNEAERIWSTKNLWQTTESYLTANRAIAPPVENAKQEDSAPTVEAPAPFSIEKLTSSSPEVTMLVRSPDDKEYIESLAVSSDGRYVIGAAKNRVYILEPAKKSVRMYSLESDVSSIGFKSESEAILCCTDGTISIRSLAYWETVKAYTTKTAYRSIRADPSGTTFYVGKTKPRSSVGVDWSLDAINLTASEIRLFKNKFAVASHFDISPDGSRIVGVGDDFDGTNLRTNLTILDTRGSLIATLKDEVSFLSIGESGGIHFMISSPSFSSDGTTVAAVTNRMGGPIRMDTKIETYSVASGLLKRSYDFNDCYVGDMTYFLGGSRLLTSVTRKNATFVECLNVVSGDADFRIKVNDGLLTRVVAAKKGGIFAATVGQRIVVFGAR